MYLAVGACIHISSPQILTPLLQPAYFIYLLRVYCIPASGRLTAFQLTNFISLANAVIAVFVVSFGPFVFLRPPAEYADKGHGQVAQILCRLFPFTRGLNHAYWAPNAWALVTALDRILLKGARTLQGSYGALLLTIVLHEVVKLLHLPVNVHEAGVISTSRGLVGDTVFAILPNVMPWHTFVITVLCQAVRFYFSRNSLRTSRSTCH